MPLLTYYQNFVEVPGPLVPEKYKKFKELEKFAGFTEKTKIREIQNRKLFHYNLKKCNNKLSNPIGGFLATGEKTTLSAFYREKHSNSIGRNISLPRRNYAGTYYYQILEEVLSPLRLEKPNER